MAAIQGHARELLSSNDDMLFSVVDRHALEQMTRCDTESLRPLDRSRLERVLDLSVWLDLYRPEVAF